jgi:hypothetical protein
MQRWASDKREEDQGPTQLTVCSSSIMLFSKCIGGHQIKVRKPRVHKFIIVMFSIFIGGYQVKGKKVMGPSTAHSNLVAMLFSI